MYQYIKTSTTVTANYPQACWVNISISELKEAAKKGAHYYFFCHINGKVNMYSSLADELVRKFAGKDIVRKDFYEFYIEHSTGKLYKKASCNAVGEICHLYREDENTIGDLISKAKSGQLSHLHGRKLQIILDVDWKIRDSKDMKEDFPEFKEYRDGTPISTTKTRQDYPEPRCRIDIDVEKLARFADDDKWIFDCNVQDERHVYYTTVCDLRTAFRRENVESGGKYQFSIDDTVGVLYSNTFRQFLLKLKKVVDRDEFMSYMETHHTESDDKGFPPFRRRNNYNITTTVTCQNTKSGVLRCCMTIPVKKMARYENTDKWIFDCNVNGERHVYWEDVGVLRAVFNRRGVQLGDSYQFLIDDTDGKLYLLLYDQFLWQLQSVADGGEYGRYMKKVSQNG